MQKNVLAPFCGPLDANVFATGEDRRAGREVGGKCRRRANFDGAVPYIPHDGMSCQDRRRPSGMPPVIGWVMCRHALKSRGVTVFFSFGSGGGFLNLAVHPFRACPTAFASSAWIEVSWRAQES